ncbi:aromatic ring-hydroxylating dioxygenase subunit alpha [Streptomyces sp. NPDC051940]|uniref:aromatic ring-hydroxylating oxygenase subunit alpha n=1 Tax=Streptomyces sp. NPDC051940 TaxID=3155675 RepID=UPI0034481D4C
MTEPSTAAANAPLLPAYYTDTAVLAAEQRRIFARTWQLAGHETDLPGPGSRIVARAGDQEVVVVRDEEGALHAHRNVCRHRGARLVTGPEQHAAIRCPYHGWTYCLDGRLVGAPEGRRFSAPLHLPSLGLLPARVEVWHGLVFVNLHLQAAPLADQLLGLDALIGRYLGELVPVGAARIHHAADSPGRVVATDANWKVAVDNYLEGYHVPVAHPGLMRLLDYPRYSAEVSPGYAYFEAPLRATRSANRMERLYQRLVSPMPGLLPEDRGVWRYVAVYPNTMIDLSADCVGAWSMIPDGVDRTLLPGAVYRHPDAGWRTRLAQAAGRRVNDLVTHEDDDIVTRVQAGLRTPGFTPGPLSEREAALGWFAGRIRTDLGRT